MNVHNKGWFFRFEKFLAPRLIPNDAAGLGKKLAETAVDLSFVSVGIYITNWCTLRIAGVHGPLFLLAHIPWTIVMCAVWWRRFVQYLPFVDPRTFLCVDGRPKRGYERSQVDFGTVNVCLKCEKDRIESMQRIGMYCERIKPVYERQGTVRNQ